MQFRVYVYSVWGLGKEVSGTRLKTSCLWKNVYERAHTHTHIPVQYTHAKMSRSVGSILQKLCATITVWEVNLYIYIYIGFNKTTMNLQAL